MRKKTRDIDKQTMNQKKSEQNYRQKAVEQQVLEKSCYFKDIPRSRSELFTRWINPQLSELKLIISDYAILSQCRMMLEIGSENSHCSLFLANRYEKDCTCVDLSPDALEVAVPIIAQDLKYNNLPNRIASDAHHLPFKNESFECVFCFATLHHFPNPRPVLYEIRRVLKNDGIFFCSWEPMKPCLSGWLITRFFGVEEKAAGLSENVFTYSEWKSFFKDAFEVVHVKVSKWSGVVSKADLGLILLRTLFIGGSLTAICFKEMPK